MSEVADARNGRIKDVVQRDTKARLVQLMEQHAPATVVWSPKTDKGWGTSAFNPNCWRTIEGGPIIPPDIAVRDLTGDESALRDWQVIFA